MAQITFTPPLPGVGWALPVPGPRLFVRCMHGLGDNIYHRPFVRAATRNHDVWLATPWPELFADLPVRFVDPQTTLRTQAKNAARHTWETLPEGFCERAQFAYAHGELREGNILQAMEKALPLNGAPLALSLPPLPESPVTGRYAVVRPVTTRSEWKNTARSPLPVYIEAAARVLRRRGYRVVSVADIDPPREWQESANPIPADVRYEHGELPVEYMLALLRDAAVVVGGVGFIVPACIAGQTPCVVVAGGQGGHNAPEVVTDPRLDTSRLRWIFPDDYCRCTRMDHDCPKKITAFVSTFNAALEALCG